MIRVVFVGLALVWCAACAPTSPWSTPEVIAYALQWDAPASAGSGQSAVFVWSGYGTEQVHQDARAWMNGALSPVLTLPLPPTHPFDQRLLPGADGYMHLLWLDAGPDGGNHLYSALLRPDQTVERGPVDVSGTAVFRYAAIASDTGTARVVWSAGAVADPQLMAADIDVSGRPLQAQPLHLPGSFPALTRNGNAFNLYWLHAGQLWYALLDAPDSVTTLSAAPGLRSGDQLEGLWAAPCGSLICVGWNLLRADGTPEFWLSAGANDQAGWPPPVRLPAVRRAAPATQSAFVSALPAAAQTDDGMGVVTFSDGDMTGFELAAPGAQADGLPALVEAGSDWLLTWAELDDDAARLMLVWRAATQP